MTSPDATRVPLGAEVSAKVYDDLRDVAIDKYGETSGNVGRVAERALEEFLGTDRYGQVEERLDDLLDREDLEVPTGAAKKTEAEARDRDGETTQVGARVRPELKERAKEQAHEWDIPLYDLVTRAFREYVYGGRADRLLDKLDRLEDAIDETVADDELAEDDVDDEPKSTAGKIADRLGEKTADRPNPGFKLEEFLEVAEAEGVTTEKYAVKKYLPKILDITETAPQPGNSSLFRPIDDLPDHRDPSNLPYHAMDDVQKREAIKIDAIRQAVDSRSQLTKYDATDAVEALGGHPRATTVRPLMREISEESPENGFEYKSNKGVLVVDPEQAQFANYDNENALLVLGLIDEDDTTEPTTSDATTSSTAPPARADGGETGDDADRDELKEEAEERLSELSEVPADA
jgi:hypothetical protein